MSECVCHMSNSHSLFPFFQSLRNKVGKCRSRATETRQDERERPRQRRKIERKEGRGKKKSKTRQSNRGTPRRISGINK